MLLKVLKLLPLRFTDVAEATTLIPWCSLLGSCSAQYLVLKLLALPATFWCCSCCLWPLFCCFLSLLYHCHFHLAERHRKISTPWRDSFIRCGAERGSVPCSPYLWVLKTQIQVWQQAFWMGLISDALIGLCITKALMFELILLDSLYNQRRSKYFSSMIHLILIVILSVGRASFTSRTCHEMGFPKWLSEMWATLLCTSKFRWETNQESIRVHCVWISCSSNSRRGPGNRMKIFASTELLLDSIWTYTRFLEEISLLRLAWRL